MDVPASTPAPKKGRRIMIATFVFMAVGAPLSCCLFGWLIDNRVRGEAAFERGGRLYDAGDYEGALVALDEAVRRLPSDHLDPDPAEDARRYNRRGNVLVKLGDYERAEEDYSQALALSPWLAAAWQNRAYARRHLGDFQGAVDDYAEAIQLGNDGPLVFNGRAIAREQLNDMPGALADFDEALRQDPEDAVIWGNRGRLRFRMDDFEHAVVDYTEALRLAPERAVTHNRLGVAHSQLGHAQPAIAAFDAALRFDPDFVSALRNRAITCWDTGQLVRAAHDLERVLELSPGDDDSRRNLEQIRAELAGQAEPEGEPGMGTQGYLDGPTPTIQPPR